MKLALTALLALATAVSAENWPQWRGPFFNGSTTETGLPTTWSATENVAWVTPLPGFSGATPAVFGDNVFVSSPDADKNLNLLCLDRVTGKVRWKTTLSTGDFTHGNNNLASPSPVTDGRHVWALFATGVLAALDCDGNVLWKRDLARDYGKFAVMWIYGSSPLLHKGRLYVQVIQRDPPTYKYSLDDKPRRDSYLLCLDPLTGREHWRHLRATDAVNESMESYTTPIPLDDKLIVVGADYVTAHRLDTGAELWRCGGLNRTRNGWRRIVPTPVVADGNIIACGPKHDPLLAIRDGKLAWETKDITPDVCTPLYYRDKLFVLDGDRQTVACLDPKTGQTRWQGKLEITGDLIRASLTGADGKLYCISEKGTVLVLEAGDDFKVLAHFKMVGPDEQPCRSSIVAAQGSLFIRTAKNLYCIRKK